MSKKSKPLLTAASIGKQYVRRDGMISEALRHHTPSDPKVPFRWIADGWRYLPHGGLFSDMGQTDEDLTRLATPAEIAAGHALPVKERKAKEGRTYTLWCFEIHSVNRWLVTNETLSVTKRTATALRRGRVAMGSKCGPIFKVAITCPAWSPK